MASTKIQNLPLKAPIGAMKIPTGGFGDYSITVSSIGDFIIDTFNLATKDYVDNALVEKEDRIDTTGGFLTPVSQNSSVPDTTNDVIDEVAQALLDRIEYVKDTFGNRPLHNELSGRSATEAHPSTSISHKSGTVYTYLQQNESDINNINNVSIPELNNTIIGKQDVIVNDVNLNEIAELTPVPSTNNAALNSSLQALMNRSEWIKNQLSGIVFTSDLPSDSKLEIIAGSIRNTGDGWKWISDAAHTPVGVTPTVTTSGINLTINYGFTAKRVVTLVATPDETLAGLGFIIGGSVGTSLTNLQIKAPIAFTVNTQTGEITAPSYHVNTINSVVTAGKCVVNHPSDGMTGSAPVVSRIGTTTPNHTDVLMTYGAAQTIFNGAGELDGYISFDGTNWVYSGNLLTPPTMTWVTSASDGYLEVNHSEVDPFNITIQERDVPIKIKVITVSENLFRLRFEDNTNTKIITPTTDMQFYFSRKATVPKNRLRGLYSVRRGYGGILPADLTSASGNIWIIGVMEVAN